MGEVEGEGRIEMKVKSECTEEGRALSQLPAGPRDLGVAWLNLGKETNSAMSVHTHIPPLSSNLSQLLDGCHSPPQHPLQHKVLSWQMIPHMAQ